MLSQNTPLIASTKNAIKNITYGKRLGPKGKSLVKSMIRSNNIKSDALSRNKMVYLAKYNKKSKPIDSINACKKIKCYEDSITEMYATIDKHFETLDTLYLYSIRMLQQYAFLSSVNFETAMYISSIRLMHFDDLDYPIRKEKDTLMNHKFKDDSLLIIAKYGFIAKHLFNELKLLKKHMNKLYIFQNKLVLEYAKKKRSCISDDNLLENYKINIDLYQEKVSEYEPLIGEFFDRFKKIKQLCKIQMKFSKLELKAYTKEKEFESRMYNTRRTSINRHHTALNKLNISQKKQSVKLKRFALMIRKKFERKVHR